MLLMMLPMQAFAAEENVVYEELYETLMPQETVNAYEVELFSQEFEFTTISGKVVDEQGNAVKDVSVLLYNVDENVSLTLCTTSAAGTWISKEYDAIAGYTYIVHYYKPGCSFDTNNIKVVAEAGGTEVSVVTASTVPVEDTSCVEGDYTYTVSSEKVTVTKYTGTDTKVSIPSVLGGYPVTKIGSFVFYDNKTVELVNIPVGVTEIGTSAFNGCISLSKVYLPISLTTIGTSVFSGCVSLADILLPGALVNIGSGAFQNCVSLKSVEIPDGVSAIYGDAFKGCTSLESVKLPVGWSSASGSIFADCSMLKEITVPDGMKRLPSFAFSGANYLEKVTLPQSLTKIDTSAFNDCAALTSVNIPAAVTEIGANAFSNCKSLSGIVLPSGLNTIGNAAFNGCIGFTSVIIPDSVQTLQGKAFRGCTNLESVTLPLGWNTAGSEIFTNCPKLTEITVPEGITMLPNQAFHGAKSLTRVTLPSTLTEIGSSAFGNCEALTDVNIPENVTVIGYSAFSGCSALTEIELPDGLVTIRNNAFEDCTGLTSVVLPDSIEDIGGSAFENCSNLASITLPVNWKSAGGDIFKNCQKLNAVTVPDGITVLPGTAFSGANYLKTVVLPAGLTIIGHSAFSSCELLANINFPDSLKTVGAGAFYNCILLTQAKLPMGVTSIGTTAFEGCENLLSFTMPVCLESAGGDIFKDCTKLSTVTVPEGATVIPAQLFENANSLRVVSLPSTLKTIEGSAFYGCSNLRLVTIPASVTSVGNYAFANCKVLRYVTFNGTKCSVGVNIFEDSPHAFIYCPWTSDITLYAIRNGIEFKLLGDEPDYSNYVVDMDKTTYYTTSNVALVEKSVPITFNYSFREDAFSSVSDCKVVLTLSESLELQSNSVYIDGAAAKADEIEYENNTLTVPVSGMSGTLTFSVTPVSDGSISTYAQMTYSRGGAELADTVGIIVLDVPMLKVETPQFVGDEPFTVKGVTKAQETVNIYVEGALAGTVTAKKDGSFECEMTLPEKPESNTVLTIKAVLESDRSVTSSAYATYRSDAPLLTQFDLYYDCAGERYIDLLNPASKVNSIIPGSPFRFVIHFDNYEDLGNVVVTSTKNSITSKLEAEPADEPGTYIAEGNFNNDPNYVPGLLNVSYTTVTTKEDVLKELTIEQLPDMWKNSTFTEIVNDEASGTYEAKWEFDEGGEVTVTSEYVTIEELRQRLLPQDDAAPNDMAPNKDIVSDIGKGFVEFLTDLSGTYGKNIATNGVDTAVINNEKENCYEYLYWDSAKDAVQSMTIKYGGAGVLYVADDWFDGFSKWSDCLSVSEVVTDFGESAIHLYKDIVNIDKARDEIMSNKNLTQAQKEAALEKVEQLKWCYYALDFVRFINPFIKEYISFKYGPLAGYLYDVASAIVFELAEDFLDKALEYFKSGGEDSFILWLIDPSGVVYDSQTGEPIQGVRTTAYWIEYRDDDSTLWDSPPADNEYGVVWDASEYSQQNPIFTDSVGYYSWVVPEGWWRVKYEKTGYDTVWSDWMPVPPIQTDVNIGLSANGNVPYEFVSVSSSESSETLSFTNNSFEVVDVTYILAAYDSSGKMVNCEKASEELASNMSITLAITFAASDDVVKIKAFAISKGGLVPLCGVWEKTVK